MPTIFISYVNENKDFAESVAQGLERAGYSTWYYTRNSVVGLSYMSQINVAIMAAQVVVLVISRESLAKAARNKQVTSEVMLAHESNKNFFPVLLNISWDEFAPKQPEWRQALAGTVAIEASPDNVDSIVEKILAGLNLLKIEPDLHTPAPSVEASYPLPLALAYQRVLAQQSGAEGAYAYHHGLQELAFALLQFISTAALSCYLGSAKRNPEVDHRLDAEFSNQDRPMYETWLAALTLVLESMKDSPDPLVQAIDRFYFDKRSRKSPGGEAITQLQGWIGLPVRKRTFVSYEDLFGLLGYYLNHDQGWGAGADDFSGDEFHRRAQTIHAALSAALDDLMNAGSWDLCGAIEAGDKLQLMRLVGASIAKLSGAVKKPGKLEDGHVYLLPAQPGAAQPALDLFPWMSLQQCSGCGGLAVWTASASAAEAFQWVCTRCSTPHPFSDTALQEAARQLNREILSPGEGEVEPEPAGVTPPHPEPPKVKEKVQLRFAIDLPLNQAWPVLESRLLCWDEASQVLSLVEDSQVTWRSPQRFLLRFVRTAPGSALAAAWDGCLAVFPAGKAPVWLQADGALADARRLDSLWIAGTWKKELFSIDSNGAIQHLPVVNEGVYRIAVLEQTGWLAAAALNGGVGLYQKDRKVRSLEPIAHLGSLAFAGNNLLVEAAGRLHTITLGGKELSVEPLAAGAHFELYQLPGSEDCLLVRNRRDAQRIDASGRRLPFFSLPPKSRLLSFCSHPGRILVAPESGGCALWDGSREIYAWKEGLRARLSQDGRALAVVSDHHAALYEVNL